MKRLGLIGEALSDDELIELVRAFGGLDMRVFLRNLLALGEHDASRILPRVTVPTLVITGDHSEAVPKGDRVLRLSANPDSADGKDSIYRYDRTGLLIALKTAGAGRGR